MLGSGITVAVPVGPEKHHQQWLDECLASVAAQTRPPDEVLLIDDMAGLQPRNGHRIWRAPWRLGIAAAMNFGVALAENELVFMLCADDTLHPECLERCLATYENTPSPQRDEAYYFVGVHYMDGYWDDQFLPGGAAMVSKSLWRKCGGFAPETSSGAPDCALMSVFMTHHESGQYMGVSKDLCLYNYRRHADSNTSRAGPWQGVILETRNVLANLWQPPEWGRYDV